ncbi:MAG: hypothetical protein ACYC66_09465 [Chloroflexota bacterium]
MLSRNSDPVRPAPGRPRLWPLVSLLLGLAALPAVAFSQPSESPAPTNWSGLAIHAAEEFRQGELQNLVVTAGGLRLGADESFEARLEPPFRVFGVYTSPIIAADAPFDALRVAFESATPQGSALSLEVRAQTAAGKWSPWQEVEVSGQGFTLPATGVAAQYRATLLAEQPTIALSLREVQLEISPADRPSDGSENEALATSPTVRLYATREGLVGRTTANGHKIVERDRFVALPSKKALNPRDGKDYQVEISYKGKKATAPVWDVGPWNTKDNYWDSPRELFNDLPRFTPQVNAAFFNNHNGGNDQFGRMILYPAAIDLADGTFWDDLGMKGSDWVDVTFLWVDAAAPPLVPMPVVVPKNGPIPQPIFQQQQQPAPAAPTPTPTPTPIPKSWYFAEGSTSKPFDTWLLLQNPDPVPANAKVTYMLPNGGQKIAEYALKPASRTSIYVNQVAPDTEVSAMVESDRYIFAERAMYFMQEGHDTAGVISPSTTWYFAEGGTASNFESWLLMQNPNKEPASATVTLFREDGSTVTHKMLIPHVSRASLLLNQLVQGSPVAARIEADRPIVAERAVYKEKGKAGTVSMGATALSKSWYMAEGVTRGGFDTWLLMLNPHDVPATATVTYMKEDGGTYQRGYLVPQRSRLSVYVNQETPNTRVATMVQSDLPIVAERSTYFPDGLGAHNSVAAPAPSKLWYLPEGSTAKPFTQNILLMNPNPTAATVTAAFMKEDGTAVEKQYVMKPTSRLTLEMNNILPNTPFSTRVRSDQPVVVERSMYFSDWSGGHSSMGIPWKE